MEFGNKLNFTQAQEKVTKTYKINIIAVQWKTTEILTSSIVFLTTILAMFLMILWYCVYNKQPTEIKEPETSEMQAINTQNGIEIENGQRNYVMHLDLGITSKRKIKTAKTMFYVIVMDLD